MPVTRSTNWGPEIALPRWTSNHRPHADMINILNDIIIQRGIYQLLCSWQGIEISQVSVCHEQALSKRHSQFTECPTSLLATISTLECLLQPSAWDTFAKYNKLSEPQNFSWYFSKKLHNSSYYQEKVLTLQAAIYNKEKKSTTYCPNCSYPFGHSLTITWATVARLLFTSSPSRDPRGTAWRAWLVL